MNALSARNFRWEMRAALLMPMAMACLEGNAVGVLANKAFIGEDAPPSMRYVVAALTAAAPLAMLSSVIWTRLFHGRDRVRCANVLQFGALLCVACIAVAPFNSVGIIMLVASTLIGRSMLTGIITARTDIWRANYRRHERARVTGRLTIATTLIIGCTSLTMAKIMDLEATGPDGYRIVYAIAIVAGLGGIACFSRIRWRGRSQHLSRERSGDEDGVEPPSPRAMLRILKRDHLYRRFMVAQFVLGAPNLAALPVFILSLEDIFRKNYTQSILLAQVIPLAVPAAAIPIWSRLLDRMHVVRYRVFHSWFFVSANVLTGLGFMLESEPIIYVGRFVFGAAIGGGMLAWSLGHHDFASRELASIYMGIHATLTGVRGALAPFLGTFLYQGIAIALVLPLAGQVTLRWDGIGSGWTFFVLAAVGAIAALMFLRMHRSIKRDNAPNTSSN
ncbi:MAG: MFS transporter [Planctomycetota bacterium]